MSNTAAITNNIKSFMASHQVVVQLHFHIVEFLPLHHTVRYHHWPFPVRFCPEHRSFQVIPSNKRFGRTRLRSPAAAFKVGTVKDYADSFFCTSPASDQIPKTLDNHAAPSILLNRAILSPYPFESLKGSEKCFATSNAKFVLFVCFAGSS